MNVLTLPVNFPNYRDLKIGDVFVWFVGDERVETKDGDPSIHAHWYRVTHKAIRYAEVSVELIKCDNYGTTFCRQWDEQMIENFSWSKIETYQHKTRWLRTPAALVLFGNRVYGQTKG